MSRAQGRALNRGLRSRVGERSRIAWAPSSSSILSQYGTEYWLASSYAAAGSSGSWLGAKGVADLALPGGSNNPSFYTHSTSGNPFGAGVDYVRLPGTAGNYVSTPDAAAYDMQSFDIRAWVVLDDWTPSATQMICAHDTGTAAENGRHFTFNVLATTGVLRLIVWQDGTAGATAQTNDSTAAPTVSDGAGMWIRATRDTTSGDVKFYTGGAAATPSWAPLGTTVTPGTLTLDVSSAALTIGSNGAGTASPLAGHVGRVQVYNGYDGAGSLVADFNPDAGTFGVTQTTLTGTGDSLTWTINCSTSGRRAWAITRDAWSFGTDDYLSVADNANFDFAASQDFTVAALFRAIQDADSQYHYIFTKRDLGGTQQGWGFFTGGTGVTEEFGAVADSGGSGAIINDTSWNTPRQLQSGIFTRTAGATGTTTLYTDATSVVTGAEAGDLSTALAMNVGRITSSGVGTLFFDGLIYGLAISRTGLTAAQVITLDTELRSLA